MTTTTLAPPVRRTRRRFSGAVPAAVPIAIGALVVLRLLDLRSGASPDEGGFLVVAGQWHAGGSSLYGDYWVDRPPLLIAIFRVADAAGGLVALRLLGILAAAAAVWLLASTARRGFGRRAAGWTAVAAAALLVTPLFGASDVNGELLALPFVALGMRAATEAVLNRDPLLARGAALLTGVAAVAALLVKQNMVDVVVFAAACWLIAAGRRRIGPRRLLDLVLFAVLGAVLGYAVVMLLALAHGTAPADVYQATYPFRVQAAQVISASTASAAVVRLHRLGLAFLVSGAPLVVAAFLALGVRRSRSPELVGALVATGAWVTFSVLAGGSFWLHYLVESVPVVALCAGALSLVAPSVVRVVASAVVASSLIANVVVLVHPSATPGTVVGSAIERAAHRGDTLVSLFGDAGIQRSAGLASPYPYLWSLPSRTLDPAMTRLRAILGSTAAPSWVVIRGAGTRSRLAATGAMAVVDRRYRPVAEVCSRTVYLRRDLVRPPVRGTGACS